MATLVLLAKVSSLIESVSMDKRAMKGNIESVKETTHEHQDRTFVKVNSALTSVYIFFLFFFPAETLDR